MKNRRVKMVRLYVAEQLMYGAGPLQTVEAEKHKVEMEIWPFGIHVVGEKIDTVLPFGNIKRFDLYPEK